MTRLISMILILAAFANVARAEDHLEQSWIDRRAEIPDHEWPIPPPAKWSEPSIIHGNAEAVWDERWKKLDGQFGAAIRVAVHLARDRHGRAARAEIPVLVRTLGLINAHSRNPGNDKRSARDHALDIAVGNQITSAVRMLGRLDPQQEEDVFSFLRELAEAVSSAEQLEKSTLPLIQQQRKHARIEVGLRTWTVGTVTWFVTTGTPLLFSAHTPWTVGGPISLVAAGLGALVWRHRVPKRFEPDDQNRVGALVAKACDDLLEAQNRQRPVGRTETKTNLEAL